MNLQLTRPSLGHQSFGVVGSRSNKAIQKTVSQKTELPNAWKKQNMGNFEVARHILNRVTQQGIRETELPDPKQQGRTAL